MQVQRHNNSFHVPWLNSCGPNLSKKSEQQEMSKRLFPINSVLQAVRSRLDSLLTASLPTSPGTAAKAEAAVTSRNGVEI